MLKVETIEASIDVGATAEEVEEAVSVYGLVDEVETFESCSSSELVGEMEWVCGDLYSYFIGEKEVPTGNQESFKTSDIVDDELSYEDKSEYDTEEDADDEGMSKRGGKDP
ncbi:hypothetical protein Sjap_013165 [Stephania japonica]|uniref:Uncharacterized protein n=1 Tax=Stephania japonica TaxID=461633 RepID=A0AAP0NYD0_9MAGN